MSNNTPQNNPNNNSTSEQVSTVSPSDLIINGFDLNSYDASFFDLTSSDMNLFPELSDPNPGTFGDMTVTSDNNPFMQIDDQTAPSANSIDNSDDQMNIDSNSTDSSNIISNNTDFSTTDFSTTDFSNIISNNTDFSTTDFSTTDFSTTDFSTTDFSTTDFSTTDFSNLDPAMDFNPSTTNLYPYNTGTGMYPTPGHVVIPVDYFMYMQASMQTALQNFTTPSAASLNPAFANMASQTISDPSFDDMMNAAAQGINDVAINSSAPSTPRRRSSKRSRRGSTPQSPTESRRRSTRRSHRETTPQSPIVPLRRSSRHARGETTPQPPAQPLRRSSRHSRKETPPQSPVSSRRESPRPSRRGSTPQPSSGSGRPSSSRFRRDSTPQSPGGIRKSKTKSKSTKATKTHELMAPISLLTDGMSAPIQDAMAVATRSPTTRRAEATRKGKTIRPMNSFMLYRKAYSDRIKQWSGDDSNQNVSRVAGASWKLESKVNRDYYQMCADIDFANHQKTFPDYKFAPRKTKKTVNYDEDSDSESDHAPRRSRRYAESDDEYSDSDYEY